MGLFSFYNKHTSAHQAGGNAAGVDAARRVAPGSNAQEPDLPEKKRARRRLVGAIVLALAAAVGLPMILDSEPKPLADDISIEIPSKDADVAAPASSAASSASSAAATVTPAASSLVAQAVAKAAADPSLSPSEQILDVAPLPAAAVARTANPSRPAEAALKPETLPSLPKRLAPEPDKMQAAVHEAMNQNKHLDAEHDAMAVDVAKTPVKTHPKAPAEVKPAGQDDEATRALDILEGKPALKLQSGKKFVLQVAALANQEKIDDLQNKLRGAGLHSYTEKVTNSSGERTRIRLGPFGSKEEADQVRARLKDIGLDVPIMSMP